MGRKYTIAAVAAVAILVAGIAFAVSRLYATGDSHSTESSVPQAWTLLRAVPSDAVAVLVTDGSRAAAKVLSDSTGILEAVVAPGNKPLMELLNAMGRQKVAVSLHNSGSLVPLVITEAAKADSLQLEMAAKAGLKTQFKDGFLLSSRSETFVNAAVRHLEEGSSILGTRHLSTLLDKLPGGAVTLLVSHTHAPKLLQVYTTPAVRKRAGFVKDLTDWSAYSVQENTEEHILLKGTALPAEEAGSFFSAFAGTPAQEASFPEVLPYFTSLAVSVPVSGADAFLAARRRQEDGQGTLVRFDKALKARAGRPLCPEEWFRSLQPREAVKAAFRLDDGVLREVVLIRSAKDLKLGAESANAYKGCLELVLGPDFAVPDSLCAQLGKNWTLFGDQPSLRAFSDKSFLDYSLKDRLADASVPVPQGFVVYASLTDSPEQVSQLFTGALSAAIKDFARGAGYAPALASLDLESQPAIKLSLDKRALKGSKVQVMERDTVVVIPTGLFPVKNHATGKTNYLYQNSHLSICLNDENGKGLWGAPFKEPLCGRVQTIDYYGNGKLQYLFAAGSKLYAIDRLGHWVNGFPVTLPKPVLLGPDAYDFSGAHGYTVMVLHRDNSLERYNLHGEKPQGWLGIKAPETVKNLPELLETPKGKWWVVRTSVRTLIYPFEGGEPLNGKEEGSRMFKPDAQIQVTGKGISAQCYDGKTRDIKLK